MPDKNNTDSSYWKRTIMGINDRKILEYIQDQVRLRLDHDRAEENLEKSEKKVRTGEIKSEPYTPPRRKLKPLDMDKLMEAGKDKEEQVY